MTGLLLDTHSLHWFDFGFAITHTAELAIARAQLSKSLYVSSISAWEIGTAITKKNPAKRPYLGGKTPDSWFADAVKDARAQVLPFTLDLALEAAKLPPIYGSGDPGDCFLLATAHILGLALVTRDSPILRFAARYPEYVSVIRC